MLEKIHKIAIIGLAAWILIVLVIRSPNTHISVSNNYPHYLLRVNPIINALHRAKYFEDEHEKQYQLTAIVLHWKRLSRVRLAVENYINANYFKQIIVWNNNPQINLTVNNVSTHNQSSNLIRLINSKQNLKDEAKYRACAEAQTLVCFYADDDWDVSRYMKTLIASFRSDPNVLHSVTNVVTYYNNMLWAFMDSRIDLHTGFSWIGCGSIFLRAHAQRHLKLLEMNLENNKNLFTMSDLFFSIWLNDIPSQMVVNLVPLPEDINTTDIPFSSTIDFSNLQYEASVLAIQKLESALHSNQSTVNISFPRKQNRLLPYCTRSPSPKDDLIFYSNVLPIDIEHIPFDIKLEPDRATYRNVPSGPRYTHFVQYNTLKAVDSNTDTCWKPDQFVKKGDFFAIDFLRIQTGLIFSLTIGHSQKLQRSLSMQISFDGVRWLSDLSVKSILSNINQTLIENHQRFVIDSRNFSFELQSFRYISFNATYDVEEPFQICDVEIINRLNVK